MRGGTILPERHFSRTIRGSSPVIAASPHAHSVPLFEVRAATTRTRPPHAHDVPDADPAGRTTDCGVLHIGGRSLRGPTPSFPHDSAILPRTSVFSERAPMCRQGLSAHGRISTALNAGEFPHDSADPPPTGSDRMCSTAPTGPMPHIRTRQHRPNTASPTSVGPTAARKDGFCAPRGPGGDGFCAPRGPGGTGSAHPEGRPWRFGRIVPSRPRRARRTNRGIMRKSAGASDGSARTILPERHFRARRPPRSPTPGPP